jgi:hypothetical protein
MQADFGRKKEVLYRFEKYATQKKEESNKIIPIFCGLITNANFYSPRTTPRAANATCLDQILLVSSFSYLYFHICKIVNCPVELSCLVRFQFLIFMKMSKCLPLSL